MIAFNTRMLAMNTHSHTPLADRIDLIISHVVDGEATAQEWGEFEAMAAADPKLWRDLAQAQRDCGAMLGAMASASVVADRVALPQPCSSSLNSGSQFPDRGSYPHPHLRLNRLGAWTGWAAAAIVTIVATLQLRNGPQVAVDRPVAGFAPTLTDSSQTSADAWDDYLNLGKRDGTVLGEMPGRVLVDSRPAPEGHGFEVVFIRQVMERRVVPDLYEVTGRDEAGQPTLAPVKPAVRGTM